MSFRARHWHALVKVSIAQHLGHTPSAPLLMSEQSPTGLGLLGEGHETITDGLSVLFALGLCEAIHSESPTSEGG